MLEQIHAGPTVSIASPRQSASGLWVQMKQTLTFSGRRGLTNKPTLAEQQTRWDGSTFSAGPQPPWAQRRDEIDRWALLDALALTSSCHLTHLSPSLSLYMYIMYYIYVLDLVIIKGGMIKCQTGSGHPNPGEDSHAPSESEFHWWIILTGF
jgi:hypothetical protein